MIPPTVLLYVRSRCGLNYANGASMDLSGDTLWDILQKECLLNRSRIKKKRGIQVLKMGQNQSFKLMKAMEVLRSQNGSQYMSSVSKAAGRAACAATDHDACCSTTVFASTTFYSVLILRF